MLFIASLVALTGLVAATITDLKTREVPDWLNYSLVAAGIGISAAYSVAFLNPGFIIASALGALLFFAIASLMFYAGQWGGGDSKLLMGMGALIGLDVSSGLSGIAGSELAAFMVNLVFAGAAYGLSWTAVIAFRNWHTVRHAVRAELRERVPIMAILVLATIAASLIASPARVYASALGLIAVSSLLLWALARAVEKTCMLKWVNPEQLTEGDWIYRDVYAAGKRICGPKDLGIQKHQIRKLVGLERQGKVKKVLIKTGIPFVPSFAIAFVITLLFGSVLRYLLA